MECSKERESGQVTEGWEEKWGGEGLGESCLEERRQTMFNPTDKEFLERQQVPEERGGTEELAMTTTRN